MRATSLGTDSSLATYARASSWLVIEARRARYAVAPRSRLRRLAGHRREASLASSRFPRASARELEQASRRVASRAHARCRLRGAGPCPSIYHAARGQTRNGAPREERAVARKLTSSAQTTSQRRQSSSQKPSASPRSPRWPEPRRYPSRPSSHRRADRW